MTIYKYNLDEDYTVIKGKIRRFLKVQRQGSHIVCWAEIDENLEEIEVRIVAIGTGWPMEDFLSEWEYIGTEIDVEGYVWHYYSDMVPNLRISQNCRGQRRKLSLIEDDTEIVKEDILKWIIEYMNKNGG